MMEHANRRYSEDEVTQIIRHTLSRGGVKDTISHDELVEIARSTGISGAKLEAAKAEWIKRHRAEFYSHLTSYCIVNGFLIFVNMWTSRAYPWAIWPIMGWGIGLAFHFRDTFFVSEERLERGARRLLKQRQRRQERIESRGFEA